ncbi:MAG: cyclic nucleotide-binding domain-containing protein [Betaproteobacteria bacterium]|nr:cyclic nucleotide-binding domain-containing protein [Betaproteobacteria bacterium]
MEELDFTKSPPATSPPVAPSAPFKAAASPFYDRAVAEKLFQESGHAERFAAGATLFVEDEKASSGGFFSRGSASRMYILSEGQVSLSTDGRTLDTVGAGEVIGEMAVITDRPRSATALAKTDCAGWSMSAEELKGALARKPEFAMMLMSVIFDRLRFVTARLASRRVAAAAPSGEPPVFDPPFLARLEQALPRSAITRYPAGAAVMREGQSGAYMYVVKAGCVAISVRDHVVAVVNPGGTFGEMALVDQSPRSATATAQAECELLSIDRPALLEVVRNQPEFAMAMLRAFAERLRHANAQIA